MSTPAPRPARTQIWILVGVFFAPLALAFLLYYGSGGWRPPGSTNHGELISPPRPLPSVALPGISGAPLAAGNLARQVDVACTSATAAATSAAARRSR